MELEEFDFSLPEGLIAEYPSAPRSHANLLVALKNLEDKKFYDLPDYLMPGDLIIMNNSKVIKANLTLSDHPKITVNLNKEIENNLWSAFAKPSRKLFAQDIFHFDEHRIIVDQKLANGEVYLKFQLMNCDIYDFLEKYGSIPIPPYIRKGVSEQSDLTNYQTIYASPPGSVAAPTAGLHFDEYVIMNLKNKNIQIDFVTLHVGAGTFLPIKTDIETHKMHSETCHITKECWDKVKFVKQNKGRIIAVGTTSLRSLEAAARIPNFDGGTFEANIFIKPGFDFQVADLLITNFHLPKSTLLILVSAFAGIQKIKTIYNHAIEKNYKFFSYGDACLLQRET